MYELIERDPIEEVIGRKVVTFFGDEIDLGTRKKYNTIVSLESPDTFRKKVAVTRLMVFVLFVSSPFWGIAMVKILVANVPEISKAVMAAIGL